MYTNIALRPLQLLGVWYLQFTQLRRQLSLPLLLLLALLQRAPLVQAFLGQASNLVASSPAHVLRSSLGLAAVLGAVDTLAGATTFVISPTGSPEGTYNLTVGTAVNVTFTVTDTPTPVVSWRTQGTLAPGLSIAGTSGAIINAANPVITGTLTTAGTYLFEVKAYDRLNGAGKTDGVWNPITFIVTGAAATAPTITTQPTPQTVTAGGTATFSVAASGTAPLSYQWRFNSTAITGATSSSYSVTNAQSANAGNYSVVVTNSAGSATSTAVSLTVNTAPTITTQPTAQVVTAGSTATFSVAASGTAPLSYQWRFNSAAITGATSSSYSVTNAQSANAGNYSVVVTNVAGSVTSNSVSLTVNPLVVAPTITTQPTAQVVTAGNTATFSVAASGTAPLGYQWQFNGASIGGATSSSYSVTNAQSANAGNYSVVVSNSAGSATSNAVSLTVNPALTAPSISTQPVAQTVTVGGTATFSVVVVGSPTMTYQWRFNSAAIGGATSSSYSVTNAQTSNAGNYSVVITNGAGSVTSTAVSLTVNVPVPLPVITLQPIGGTVVPGQVVVLNAKATGAVSYQWYKDGSPLTGETNDNLVLPNVVSATAGTYTFVATNTTGSVNSSGAVLVVGTNKRAPVVNVSTLSTTVGGSPFTMGFVVSGTSSQTVLIRASGPSLGTMITGTIADPIMQVFNSNQAVIAQNDDWSPNLAPTFTTTGAFAFLPGSKDAALVITLPPGNYTVEVRDAANATGKALAEVFLVEHPVQ